MRINKTNRHRIYESLLAKLNERIILYTQRENDIHCDGLCFTLGFVRCGLNMKFDFDINDLPELMAYRPEGITNSELWFDVYEYGINKRRSILASCIEQTIDKRKHNNQ